MAKCVNGCNGLQKNSGFRMKLVEDIPQGLKPTLILLPLRHD
jgi:hypothetical protein